MQQPNQKPGDYNKLSISVKRSGTCGLKITEAWRLSGCSLTEGCLTLGERQLRLKLDKTGTQWATVTSDRQHPLAVICALKLSGVTVNAADRFWSTEAKLDSNNRCTVTRTQSVPTWRPVKQRCQAILTGLIYVAFPNWLPCHSVSLMKRLAGE